MKRKVMSMALALLLSANVVHAFQFEVSDTIKGSLDTTTTAGFGIRLNNPSPSLVGDPSYSAVANTDQWSNGDNGNLNYRKGNPYTTYAKLTPELIMQFPAQIKFMARGTFLYDFMATETSRTSLPHDARDQVARDLRLLDLWVSKEFP